MSRANAQVRYPDGTIRYGIYNGTVDVFMAFLTDSNENAWKLWKQYRESGFNGDALRHPEDTEVYDVEIANNYGGGRTYKGTATKHEITSDVDTDYMDELHDGLPEWWIH